MPGAMALSPLEGVTTSKDYTTLFKAIKDTSLNANNSMDKETPLTRRTGGRPPFVDVTLQRNSDSIHLPPSLPLTPVKVGGRISQFYSTWSAITTDKWVLDIVARGHVLEFTKFPPNSPPRGPPPSHLKELLAPFRNITLIWAIEPVPRAKGNGILFQIFPNKEKNRGNGAPSSICSSSTNSLKSCPSGC